MPVSRHYCGEIDLGGGERGRKVAHAMHSGARPTMLRSSRSFVPVVLASLHDDTSAERLNPSLQLVQMRPTFGQLNDRAASRTQINRLNERRLTLQALDLHAHCLRNCIGQLGLPAPCRAFEQLRFVQSGG
jgi:hypothetical protein